MGRRDAGNAQINIMAHDNQQKFFQKIKEKHPDFFDGKIVLECGSLNVNGSFRPLFSNCDYTGIDIVLGPDVDLVSKAHEAPFFDESFDVVVSGEMLEHDEYWKLSLQKMYAVLKHGGLMVISCAGKDRPEHGTARSGTGIWATSPDYYMNLEPKDIAEVLKPEMFSEFGFEENGHTCDTYFFGIKA